MGFRFQRRFRILPGIRINLSKSGVSTSIGTRGAHVTIGHGQVRETVGLPGTGLSYTETQRIGASAPPQAAQAGPPGPYRWRASVVFFFIAMALIAFSLWKMTN